MTLVELMLGLTITAMIGLSVVMMLDALSYGTTSQATLRNAVVKLQATRSRIDASVRGSAMVLDQADGRLFLWTADTRDNDEPNLSELRVIEFDSDTGGLVSYAVAFPENWTAQQIEAADTSYPLNTNFAQLVANFKSHTHVDATPWASGLDDWVVVIDQADPQQASLVNYRLTATVDDVTEVAIGAVNLRNGS